MNKRIAVDVQIAGAQQSISTLNIEKLFKF
jgi:hypothetical protein